MAQSKHEKIERNVFLMIVLTLMTVSVGGLVEIVPLFFQHSTTEPVEGVKPYEPLVSFTTGTVAYTCNGTSLYLTNQAGMVLTATRKT